MRLLKTSARQLQPTVPRQTLPESISPHGNRKHRKSGTAARPDARRASLVLTVAALTLLIWASAPMSASARSVQDTPTASQTAAMQIETLENMAFLGERVHFDLTGVPRHQVGEFTYEWDVYADGVIDEATERPSLTWSFAQPGQHTIAVTRQANGESIATARTTINVIQLRGRDPQSDSWLHTVDNPPFFSGEVGTLGETTLYKFGLGIPITPDWAIRVSWAQGPAIRSHRRYPLELQVAAADLQVISKLSEYLRVGLGGGAFIAKGSYRLDWPTKGSKTFTNVQPFISASVGAQWKFILVTLGVHYVP